MHLFLQSHTFCVSTNHVVKDGALAPQDHYRTWRRCHVRYHTGRVLSLCKPFLTEQWQVIWTSHWFGLLTCVTLWFWNYQISKASRSVFAIQLSDLNELPIFVSLFSNRLFLYFLLCLWLCFFRCHGHVELCTLHAVLFKGISPTFPVDISINPAQVEMLFRCPYFRPPVLNLDSDGEDGKDGMAGEQWWV